MYDEIRNLESLTKRDFDGNYMHLLHGHEGERVTDWTLKSRNSIQNPEKKLYGAYADRLALYESTVPALLKERDELEEESAQQEAFLAGCERIIEKFQRLAEDINNIAVEWQETGTPETAWAEMHRIYEMTLLPRAEADAAMQSEKEGRENG